MEVGWKLMHLCLPILGEYLNSPGKADVGDVTVEHALPLKPRSDLILIFVSSDRSSYSDDVLVLVRHQLFQILSISANIFSFSF